VQLLDRGLLVEDGDDDGDVGMRGALWAVGLDGRRESHRSARSAPCASTPP
jgi:hypothetical protein